MMRNSLKVSQKHAKIKKAGTFFLSYLDWADAQGFWSAKVSAMVTMVQMTPPFYWENSLQGGGRTWCPASSEDTKNVQSFGKQDKKSNEE